MTTAAVMRFIQAGILVCLIAITALLYGIYNGGQAQAPRAEDIDFTIPTVGPPASAVAVYEPRALNASPQRRPKPRPIAAAAPPAVVAQPLTVNLPLVEAIEPAPPPPAPVRAEPPPTEPEPVAAREVTIAAGTRLVIRLQHTLSSERNEPGDDFPATLDEPLIVDGLIVADRGAQVEGRIVDSQRAGRLKGVSYLSCELSRLHTDDGQWIDLKTSEVEREGDSQRNSDLKKVALGAGVGAIIGAIGGGGKGAAIGAGVGGGAGAGAAAAKRGDPVVLRPETRLSFFLEDSVRIVERL